MRAGDERRRSGHILHTAAVFVTVAGAPVRASVADAQFYVDWIDQLIRRRRRAGCGTPTSRTIWPRRRPATRRPRRSISRSPPAATSPRPWSGTCRRATGRRCRSDRASARTFNEALDAATVIGHTFLLEDASHAPWRRRREPTTRGCARSRSRHRPARTTPRPTPRRSGGRRRSGIKEPAGPRWRQTCRGRSPPRRRTSTPPTVTSRSPASGATGVAPSTTVTATFSEALDPATVSTSTFELRDAVERPRARDGDATSALEPSGDAAPDVLRWRTHHLHGDAEGGRERHQGPRRQRARLGRFTGRSPRRPGRRRRRPRDRADRSS